MWLYQRGYTDSKEACERRSVSLVIGEIQIKVTMRHHCAFIGKSKIKTPDHTKRCQGSEASGILLHVWGNYKMARLI